MSEGLPVWTVYDHPNDFPHCFVARLFDGERPTATIMVAGEIETIRARLVALGLAKLARHPDDDQKIMEVWL